MKKIHICIYLLFLIIHNLYSMNRAEELRQMHAILMQIAANSPTLLDRVLREAGVQENEMAQVAQEIYAHRRPIPVPYASLHDLLERMITATTVRPITTTNIRHRKVPHVMPFLKPKINKRSQ